MGRLIVAMLLLGVLTFGFMGSAYASYTGMGLAGSSTYSLRQGSIGGLNILGGGPGSGK